MYDIVIRLHYVVSAIFLILALITTAWALVGWIRNLPCPRSFMRLSWVFIHFLYIQLLTGITLYFFLKPESSDNIRTMEEALEHNSQILGDRACVTDAFRLNPFPGGKADY